MYKLINGSLVNVRYKEDEPGIDGLGDGSPQDNVDLGDDAPSSAPPDDQAKPTLPDDSQTFTLPDGTEVTYGELRKGYTKAQNLEGDYTRKTQEAAAMKGEAEALKAEAEGDLSLAQNLRNAVAEDIQWYNTHPQSEWGSYTPKADQILEGKPAMNTSNTPQSTTPTTPQTPPDNSRIDALEQRINQREQQEAVDTVLSQVDTLVGSDGNELVTRKLLLNGVKAYQASNKGKLPDATQLKTIAKEIQDDLANAGVPIPRGHVSPDGSTKARPVSEVAASVTPNWQTLNMNRSPREIESALSSVMREKAQARG